MHSGKVCVGREVIKYQSHDCVFNLDQIIVQLWQYLPVIIFEHCSEAYLQCALSRLPTANKDKRCAVWVWYALTRRRHNRDGEVERAGRRMWLFLSGDGLVGHKPGMHMPQLSTVKYCHPTQLSPEKQFKRQPEVNSMKAQIKPDRVPLTCSRMCCKNSWMCASVGGRGVTGGVRGVHFVPLWRRISVGRAAAVSCCFCVLPRFWTPPDTSHTGTACSRSTGKNTN